MGKGNNENVVLGVDKDLTILNLEVKFKERCTTDILYLIGDIRGEGDMQLYIHDNDINELVIIDNIPVEFVRIPLGVIEGMLVPAYDYNLEKETEIQTATKAILGDIDYGVEIINIFRAKELKVKISDSEEYYHKEHEVSKLLGIFAKSVMMNTVTEDDRSHLVNILTRYVIQQTIAGVFHKSYTVFSMNNRGEISSKLFVQSEIIRDGGTGEFIYISPLGKDKSKGVYELDKDQIGYLNLKIKERDCNIVDEENGVTLLFAVPNVRIAEDGELVDLIDEAKERLENDK